jgi:prepilin-type N-terminal cleavage/methylation domain-containing protein
VNKREELLSGFTLLELAITAAILGLAACGIFSLLISSATLADSAGNITIMSNVAKQEFENNIQRANFDTLNTYSRLPPNVPAGTSLVCYVQDHPTVNDIKIVRIVVSYRGKSNRVIGEDQNLNGVLDGGEDRDANGRLSSLCEMTTFVARTQ